jgi:hypothetical protein
MARYEILPSMIPIIISFALCLFFVALFWPFLGGLLVLLIILEVYRLAHDPKL